MTEDLTALKDKIIISQQKQIRALQAECHQLKQDNEYLKKVLSITLRDNLKGIPVVISQERFRETSPEFMLEHNFDGDLLIRIRRTGI